MIGFRFNTPPGWPPPPPGWTPPEGWQPQSDWPPAPPRWQFWVADETVSQKSVPEHVGPGHDQPTRDVPDVATDPAAEAADLDAPASPSGVAPSAAPSTAEDSLAADGETDSPLSYPRRGATAESAVASDEATPPGQPRGEAGTPSGASSRQRAELERVARQRDALAQEVEHLRRRLEGMDTLAEVGIYQFRHPLDSSAEYKEELDRLREEIKDLVRRGHAIVASDMFAYNNSLAQGRRMVGDLSRLMLRAYNAEAENCVRTVRATSVTASVARLGRSVEAIAKLGQMMDMRVSSEFHGLRVREIELTGDFLMKVQVEREDAREERERLREERKAEMELAAERERLQKERSHYVNALTVLLQQGKEEEAAQLKERLGDIERAIEENDYRAANIRAGYVYVISNLGAFGSDVVKIGMTRRLDPLDRIRELGDASVPFPFDVHAIYFSDDAVGLENSLHKAFADDRLNQVNLRREFFYATPDEVKIVLASQVGNLLEFTDEPDAEQYRQSVSIREQLQH